MGTAQKRSHRQNGDDRMTGALISNNPLQWPDFFRLAEGLKAMKVDFDYAKTRRLLDPHWDGYDMPKDHDIVDADVPLPDANLLTSEHREGGLHRVILDLDYGAAWAPGSIKLMRRQLVGMLPASRSLEAYGVTFENWQDRLELRTSKDFVLIESSTNGHYHLILDVNIPWPEYRELLNTLARGGVIEPGYAKASLAKGFSAIRTPWVRKEIKCAVPT